MLQLLDKVLTLPQDFCGSNSPQPMPEGWSLVSYEMTSCMESLEGGL